MIGVYEVGLSYVPSLPASDCEEVVLNAYPIDVSGSISY